MRLAALVVLLAVIFGGFLGGSSAFWVNHWFEQSSVTVTERATVEIEKGNSFSDVTNQLVERGILRGGDALKFKVIAQLQQKTEDIKVGEYSFEGEVTPKEVLERIERGQRVIRYITLPEGKPVEAVWRKFGDAAKLKNDIEGLDYDGVLNRLELYFEASHLEGLFFPDTYSYLAGNSATSVLQRAHDKLYAVLQDAWDARSEDVQVENIYELLILASIIERESGVSRDRKQISGVLHRRLGIDMLLQVDPTVIYGLGDAFDGDLKTKHMRMDHEYNTYVHKGLPPSPICMPSKDSILAAANPQPGDAMYFVGRGDGTSQFSATLREHNQAVQKYQMK